MLRSHQHPFFLIRSLTIPTLLFLAACTVLLLGLQGAGPAAATGRLHTLLVPALTGVIALAPLWGMASYWEWANDTLTVTNQRIVINRRMFRLYEVQSETELGRVQHVTVRYAGPLAALFDFGTLEVGTASATANLAFHGLPRPQAAKDLIFRAQEQAQHAERRERQSNLAEQVRRQFGQAQPEPARDDSAAGYPAEGEAQ